MALLLLLLYKKEEKENLIRIVSENMSESFLISWSFLCANDFTQSEVWFRYMVYNEYLK